MTWDRQGKLLDEMLNGTGMLKLGEDYFIDDFDRKMRYAGVEHGRHVFVCAEGEGIIKKVAIGKNHFGFDKDKITGQASERDIRQGDRNFQNYVDLIDNTRD